MGGSVDQAERRDLEIISGPQASLAGCAGSVFSKSRDPVMPPGRRIVFSLVTWNTRDVSMESLSAYVREARMLYRLGHAASICICDNGSTDGTPEALRAFESEMDLPHRFIFNSRNLGSSTARNQVIDYVLECGADYVMLMDGDVEIVPFSSFAMLRYMENCGHWLGCVGADSSGHTQHRERTTPYLFSISGSMLKTCDYVAWTQYGMFRRAVFDEGIRFDTRGPFDQPGWGFEDNDLAFQMQAKGYLIQHFFGMTYLHRQLRSSLRILRESGFDPAKLYAQRKQYVIDKWSSVLEDRRLAWLKQDRYPESGCPVSRPE